MVVDESNHGVAYLAQSKVFMTGILIAGAEAGVGCVWKPEVSA